MILDTSALLAVLYQEEDAVHIVEAIVTTETFRLCQINDSLPGLASLMRQGVNWESHNSDGQSLQSQRSESGRIGPACLPVWPPVPPTNL